MATDRRAYFSRIGYAARAEATLAALRDLVAAHNRSIPFENLDPLVGVPVGDLSVEVLVDKLVYRRRGGYCYEHNGLLAHTSSTSASVGRP
jgi:arylamine N-acetyltransferase